MSSEQQWQAIETVFNLHIPQPQPLRLEEIESYFSLALSEKSHTSPAPPAYQSYIQTIIEWLLQVLGRAKEHVSARFERPVSKRRDLWVFPQQRHSDDDVHTLVYVHSFLIFARLNTNRIPLPTSPTDSQYE